MSVLWVLCLVILAVGATLLGWVARDTADAVAELRDACNGLRSVQDDLALARAEADDLHARLVATHERRVGRDSASELLTPEG